MDTTFDGRDLDAIKELRDMRADLAEQIEQLDLALQTYVRNAFDAGIHYTDIMAASGLSKARVYQVAKGTRR